MRRMLAISGCRVAARSCGFGRLTGETSSVGTKGDEPTTTLRLGLEEKTSSWATDCDHSFHASKSSDLACEQGSARSASRCARVSCQLTASSSLEG
jgi:hypothetical protein